MNLKIITVGNGAKGYPGNFTKEENDIIYCNYIGKILHLFSGRSDIGDFRIDFFCKEATHKMDVFDFLKNYHINDFETVIIDAPYNQKFANKYQKIGSTPKQFVIFANVKKTTELFRLIIEKINPQIIILKSWNYYVPKGYKLKEGYLCYAGGFRKPTILEVLSII